MVHGATLLAHTLIPTIPDAQVPGFAKILTVLGFMKSLVGASLIACFLGGLIAFTVGRVIDHHRTGRVGLIFIMASLGGALLYAIGPDLLNTLGG